VGAVILDDAGRLLVIKRGHEPSTGLWSVPGGRIEPGEEPREAVRREVAEETGLVVGVGALLGSVDIPSDTDPDNVYVVEDYRCTVTTTVEPTAGDDADDARWVTRDEFDRLDLVPGLRHALNSWSALPR